MQHQGGSVSMMRRGLFLGGLLFAGIILAVGCAGTQYEIQAPDDDIKGLPPVSSLERQSSGYRILKGKDYCFQQGGHVTGDTLVFGPPSQDNGGSAEGSSGQKGDLGPQSSDNLLAYAIYVFSLADLAAAVDISAGMGYKDKLWIGLANWERGAWDFSVGTFISSPEIVFDDLPLSANAIISNQGLLAVALVFPELTEQKVIKELELLILDEVENFDASRNRPDGILASWDYKSQAVGYRLSRRLKQLSSESWTLLTPEPLGRYDDSFLDDAVQDSVEYEYRLETAYAVSPGGSQRLLWSPGTTAIGLRRLIAAPVELPNIDYYLPANAYRSLTFFYSPRDSTEVGMLRALDYPPALDWESVDPGTGQLAPVQLVTMPGFEPPMALYQKEVSNNPIITLGYSVAGSTYVRVISISPEGEMSWGEQTPVRDTYTCIQSLLSLPRRLGMIVWNSSMDRLELVDSIDSAGLFWYDFDPVGCPWMIIDERKPEGRVEALYLSAGATVCYRNANSGEIVAKVLAGGYWQDITPGVFGKPAPRLREITVGMLLNGLGLFYVDETGQTLRLLRRDFFAEWLMGDIQDLVTVTENQQIQSFDVFVASNRLSEANYLVYCVDGVVTLLFSHSPSLEQWHSPVVIDASGVCRDVHIIPIGADENWAYELYVTYIKDDIEGNSQLCFQDLKFYKPF